MAALRKRPDLGGMEGWCPYLFIAAGIASGVFGIFHEWRWRVRLDKWMRTKGVIVGEVEGPFDADVSYSPEIEFSFQGQPKRFVSRYGGSVRVILGTEVNVLYEASTGDAEEVSGLNRWLFTLVPLAFGILFLLLGSGMKVDEDCSENLNGLLPVSELRK